MKYEITKATIDDIKRICYFTDFWLAGRGKRIKAPGAVDDYFISPSQHRKYIIKYTTNIAVMNDEIIAWSVVEPSGTMIHLLVAGNHRGHGIGSKMLRFSNPVWVRSKSNQSSGNPASFYESHGYKKTESVTSQGRLDIDRIKPDRKKIIDIFIKK